MKTYNVKEIAELLGTNQETVRRWIRAGKLAAESQSRKTGNVVSEEALYQFVKNTSKYTAIATRMAASNPVIGIPSVIGALSVGVLTSVLGSNIKKSDPVVTKRDIEAYLKKEITKRKKQIQSKEETISRLKDELESEKNKLEEYEFTLAHIDEVSDQLIK